MPQKKKRTGRPASAPSVRSVEIRRAIINMPDTLVVLLASYHVVPASKRVEAHITATVDAVEPLSRERLHGVSATVASKTFKYGGTVAQDFAEVAAGNWLFERFVPAFELITPGINDGRTGGHNA